MKICTNCGNQLQDDYKVCPNCGLMVNNNQSNYTTNNNMVNNNFPPVGQYNQVPNYIAQYQQVQSNRINNVSLVGLILSIISLLLFPYIFGFAGLSCGLSGLAQIKKTNEGGKALAIISIIIGIFSIIFAIFSTVNK